jgi:hypothetical protein
MNTLGSGPALVEELVGTLQKCHTLGPIHWALRQALDRAEILDRRPTPARDQTDPDIADIHMPGAPLGQMFFI